MKTTYQCTEQRFLSDVNGYVPEVTTYWPSHNMGSELTYALLSYLRSDD